MKKHKHPKIAAKAQNAETEDIKKRQKRKQRKVATSGKERFLLTELKNLHMNQKAAFDKQCRQQSGNDEFWRDQYEELLKKMSVLVRHHSLLRKEGNLTDDQKERLNVIVPAQKANNINKAMKKWLVVHHWKLLVQEAQHCESAVFETSRNRNSVLRELFETEAEYCRSLHILIHRFKIPLEKHNHITAQQSEMIFSTIDLIHAVSQNFSNALNYLFGGWPKNQSVGETIAKYLGLMQCYSAYVTNYDKASETLNTLLEKKKNVASFLAAVVATTTQKLDCAAYLIMPIQRLPRYVLLLQNLVAWTPKDHVDYTNLQEAHKVCTQLTAWVNKRKEERDISSELDAMMMEQNKKKTVFSFKSITKSIIGDASPVPIATPRVLAAKLKLHLSKAFNVPSGYSALCCSFTLGKYTVKSKYSQVKITAQTVVWDEFLVFNVSDRDFQEGSMQLQFYGKGGKKKNNEADVAAKIALKMSEAADGLKWFNETPGDDDGFQVALRFQFFRGASANDGSNTMLNSLRERSQTVSASQFHRKSTSNISNNFRWQRAMPSKAKSKPRKKHRSQTHAISPRARYATMRGKTLPNIESSTAIADLTNSGTDPKSWSANAINTTMSNVQPKQQVSPQKNVNGTAHKVDATANTEEGNERVDSIQPKQQGDQSEEEKNSLDDQCENGASSEYEEYFTSSSEEVTVSSEDEGVIWEVSDDDDTDIKSEQQT
eukprot:TRINITY_DN9755_c0_g1_i1.p1 TRINITY_DN9755_c0_g1~~TRINITY_DN9755_c0_g1_i1.p1  ORF type:complete len:716 (+),score=118.41 TRINITY_DN9755_c0_g1_i1:44-2191(+)